jgi:hypothetical protein
LRLDSQHSVHKKLAIFKEQTALLEKCLEQDTEIAKSTKLGPGSPEEDDDDLLVTSLELALLGFRMQHTIVRKMMTRMTICTTWDSDLGKCA